MARVKRGVTSHKRHKRLLKAAEGRKGTRSRLVKPARLIGKERSASECSATSRRLTRVRSESEPRVNNWTSDNTPAARTEVAEQRVPRLDRARVAPLHRGESNPA